MRELDDCRSLLYVPAHVPRFVDKAGQCGTDGVVLDLEDSVPALQKDAARAALPAAVAALTGRGLLVLVRINHDEALAPLDLAAAVKAGAHGLVVPKVDTAAQLAALARRVEQAEAGGARGRTVFVAQVESVHALPHLDEIACAPRVAALNLGADDFCVSAGAVPCLESLALPTQQLLFAARRAGVVPLGFAGSVSDYADLEAFAALIRHARRLGFRGALCIHPDQVTVLNREFAPSPEEIREATDVVEAYEQAVAAGRGAAALRGRMIDAPVVARARALLRRADR